MEMNEKRSAMAHMYDDDNNIYVKLHLDKSKPFKNSRKFDFESIDTRAFINGITNSALLLYNHDRSKPICRLNSERVQMTYDDKAIEFAINLPNISYANDLRELAREGILEMSFSFKALQEEIRNRTRYISDLLVGEVSLLSVPAQYPTESRKQDETDLKQLLIDTYTMLYMSDLH